MEQAFIRVEVTFMKPSSVKVSDQFIAENENDSSYERPINGKQKSFIYSHGITRIKTFVCISH